MTTIFVKYDIDEHRMRVLVDMDIGKLCSKKISECQFFESMIFQQCVKNEFDFNEVLSEIEIN